MITMMNITIVKVITMMMMMMMNGSPKWQHLHFLQGSGFQSTERKLLLRPRRRRDKPIINGPKNMNETKKGKP